MPNSDARQTAVDGCAETARPLRAARWLWAVALSIVALATVESPCPAANAADEIDPVDSAGQALEDLNSPPWYDAQTDELRPVEVRAPDDPPARHDVAAEERETSSREIELPWYLLSWLGIGLICVLITLLLAFMIYKMLDSSRGYNIGPAGGARRIVSNIDRMEQLPVPLKRNLSDLLGEARRQYERGNYNEAIIYLYSYLLVELDKAQRIRLLRGKTNRQYLRELRDAPPSLSTLVEHTMVAFEDVFFGDRELQRGRFEACYNQLNEFQSHLEPAAA